MHTSKKSNIHAQVILLQFINKTQTMVSEEMFLTFKKEVDSTSVG